MGKAQCFLCPHFTELEYALIFINSLGIRYRDTRKVIFLRALKQSYKGFNSVSIDASDKGFLLQVDCQQNGNLNNLFLIEK